MRGGRTLVLTVPWAWLALFLLAPCAIVLAIALAEPADAVPPFSLAHPGLDNLVLVVTDPLYRGALGLSLKVAGISTLACLLAGYPMALAIARSGERWRAPLLLLVMLPFWTGFLMRINAWIGLLQDDGWINAVLGVFSVAPLHLLYTDAAMYVGVVYTYLPFMVLPLYARLSQLDPVLLDAAADLGARPWRAFLRVTLPLSLPGVFAGTLLTFIPAAGDFINAQLLGSPKQYMIGNVIQSKFLAITDYPAAAALSFTLMAAILVLVVIYARLLGTERLTG
jgi:putrescine transport system permease protein